MSYLDFINQRGQSVEMHGFDPVWMPDCLFDFQLYLVEWSLRKGRSAIFADCGLGKSLMELVWAANVVRQTKGRVLLVTPIAVGLQMLQEAEKFGIDGCSRSKTGDLASEIIVTNYERLHYFDAKDFSGVVCDESSILKDFKSKTKDAVTAFIRQVPYRLLATATAAPNDFHELGTSSEALGELGYRDMITKYFKEDQRTHGSVRQKYRFREHAKIHFWRWVSSWARACRKPSDIGFSDDRFELPPLHINEHTVKASRPADGMLFALPARDFREERAERKATINERCDKVKDLIAGKDYAVCWGHGNAECDRMEQVIDGAVQVSGKDSDDNKEAKFEAFQRGDAPYMVIKPKIGAWGLNWQHCCYMTTFPSHSYEQYYQSMRRLYRFGQQRPVTVDIVTTEGEERVLKNLTRKASQADQMFTELTREMQNATSVELDTFTQKSEAPPWM